MCFLLLLRHDAISCSEVLFGFQQLELLVVEHGFELLVGPATGPGCCEAPLDAEGAKPPPFGLEGANS